MAPVKPFETEVYEEIERIIKNPPENKLIHSFYVARELLTDPTVFDRSNMNYMIMDCVFYDTISVYAVKDLVKEIDVQYLDIEVKRISCGGTEKK